MNIQGGNNASGDYYNTAGYGLSTGTITLAGSYGPDYQQVQQQQLLQLIQNQAQKGSMISGDKPLVVCGSETVTCKDLDEAQRKAEELAHKLSQNAYILKPIKMVAPKRDVVTTDLP